MLDASAVAPFLLPDERGAAADTLIARMLAGERVLVPALFVLEITNILVSSVRRGRITADDAVTLMESFGQWPILVEDRVHRAGQIFALAVHHGLSAYDACYLDLAVQTGGTLATSDHALARAALAEGVELVTPAA